MNPLTAFLRAKDRIVLCETACELKKCGLCVTGFANGRIRVDSTGLAEAELYSAAQACGCLPPYLALANELQSCPAGPLALLQAWYAYGALARLLEADKLLVQKILAFAEEKKRKEDACETSHCA